MKNTNNGGNFLFGMNGLNISSRKNYGEREKESELNAIGKQKKVSQVLFNFTVKDYEPSLKYLYEEKIIFNHVVYWCCV